MYRLIHHSLFALFSVVLLSINVANASPKEGPHNIVATFSILGDLVKQIGRDKIVLSIVGPNSDAHTYEPTPKDAKMIGAADIVFVNGLGFEGWMDRLVESSGYQKDVIVASKGVKPRFIEEEGDTIEDPHAWHDLEHVKIYIQNIEKALSAFDPQNAPYYQANAKAYIQKLDALHQWLMNALKQVPESRRQIITAHDAFGYFSQRYGVKMRAPVGTSTEAEPTVQAVVELIKAIQKHNIKTIFVENISNPKIIQQISEETGAKIGNVIYSDALSNPDEPGYDFLSLFKHNATQFLNAMKA